MKTLKRNTQQNKLLKALRKFTALNIKLQKQRNKEREEKRLKRKLRIVEKRINTIFTLAFPKVGIIAILLTSTVAQGQFENPLNLSSLDAQSGLKFQSNQSLDETGFSVSIIGDINGDGYDDLGIGAPKANNSEGKVYIVFGTLNINIDNFDLTTLNGTNGFTVLGNENQTGYSISGIGDFNGDGIDDMAIGIPGDLFQNNISGKTVIVYGSTLPFAATFSVDNLKSNTGVVLVGQNENLNFGRIVGNAGDFNGDGFNDVIIGAMGPSGNSIPGRSYLIFGSNSLEDSIHVEDLNGTNGIVFNDEPVYGNFGVMSGSAGDFNNDGFDDIVLTSWNTHVDNVLYAGSAYFIYGDSTFTQKNYDLTQLDGSKGFRVNGLNERDYLGLTFSEIGDFNGDGIHDVILGAPGNSTTKAYVLFGSETFNDSLFNLNNLDGNNGFLITEGDDLFIENVSGVRDYNGDGFDDILIGNYYEGSGGQGGAHIIFGTSQSQAEFNLNELDGINGFSMVTNSFGGDESNAVSGSGDFNGDGYADLLIGSVGGDGPNEAYLVYGEKLCVKSIIDSIIPATCTNPIAKIYASAKDGVPPYNYSWSSNPNVNDSVGEILNSGIQTLKTTDSRGCFVERRIPVSIPQFGVSDLRIDIDIPILRPGFTESIMLNVQNQNCLESSGKLKFVLDKRLQFISTSIPFDDYKGDTLIWSIDSLHLGKPKFSCEIKFTIAQSVAIGDEVCFNAFLTDMLNDYQENNNQREHCETVVGSYDPNDITVYPQGKCDPNYVENYQALTYRVRFQNTGTAMATNVTIKDTLDSSIDLSSVKIINQSHSNLLTEIESDSVLVFSFPNINLPDSSMDNEKSNGFIVFEVMPNQNVQYGTKVINKAHIYFDYNDAIETNQVKSTLVNIAPQIDTTITLNENILTVAELNGEYEWKKCNSSTNLTDNTNQSFSPKTVGNYAVTIQKEGCIAETSCSNYIITALNYTNGSYFKIYPNPTTNLINIDGNGTIIESLLVTNIEGKTVLSKNSIQNKVTNIKLNDLKPGMYFIHIQSQKSNHRISFIKK